MLDFLLSTLKSCQLEAIKHTQGPQLILAGAGETTTITIKHESAGSSRIGALDEHAIDDLIETAKIAYDHEDGFGRTKEEKGYGE